MNEDQIKLFQSKNNDNYATPKELYEELDKEFSFNYDPCPLFSTFDGLKTEWVGNIFVNPPYSNIIGFLEKAHKELNKKANLIVFLVFANTDTNWFHKYIYNRAEIRFIKGRLKFRGFNEKGEEVNNSAMRPSMICILRRPGL